MGLGSAFISERWNIKEAATLSGAAGAVSERLGIATAATNHNTRHPIVTACYATTMHRLTGGRFTLGLGRGIDAAVRRVRHPPHHHGADRGLRRPHAAAVEGRGGLRARRARRVSTRSSTSTRRSTRTSRSGSRPSAPTRWRCRGRVLDMVVLHTFFTDETIGACVDTVRRAAEEAGRDPGRGARLVVLRHRRRPPAPRRPAQEDRRAPGHLPPGLRRPDGAHQPLGPGGARAVPGRRGGAVGRAAPSTRSPPPSSSSTSPTLLPDEWLAPAARGSAAACADAVLAQFDLGVDGVIMHGASPAELDARGRGLPGTAARRPLRRARRQPRGLNPRSSLAVPAAIHRRLPGLGFRRRSRHRGERHVGDRATERVTHRGAPRGHGALLAVALAGCWWPAPGGRSQPHRPQRCRVRHLRHHGRVAAPGVVGPHRRACRRPGHLHSPGCTSRAPTRAYGFAHRRRAAVRRTRAGWPRRHRRLHVRPRRRRPGARRARGPRVDRVGARRQRRRLARRRHRGCGRSRHRRRRPTRRPRRRIALRLPRRHLRRDRCRSPTPPPGGAATVACSRSR